MPNQPPRNPSLTNVRAPRDRGAGRAKAAALAEAQRRRDRRRRYGIVGGSVVAVIAVILVMVVVSMNNGKGGGNGVTRPAPAAVVSAVTSVPAATLDAVGVGVTTGHPSRVSGPPLTLHGKPEVLYLGAEYCPYCATERWAMVQALSRFGTWHDLYVTRSGPNDGNVPTLSFRNATYTSPYLSFVSREMFDRNGQPFQKVTAAQNALAVKYTGQSNWSIPFIDFGNRYVITGATFSYTVLQGHSQAQIATAMSNASSPIAQQAIGAANSIAAALCQLTGGQPANVCTAKAVTSWHGKF